ncbi:MAG: peptidoglycan DD-metalloendopeptidase family protein [Actinomycetota bacterium]|nr:peptidoglycan DD-metalloendopeptidase family protein [Actinomycetota bacterium]
MKQVRRVIFEGRRGRRDDATARVRRPRATKLVARVPRLARSGRVVLVDKYGGRSRMSRVVRVARAPKAPSMDIAPGSRFFYGGRRRPSVTLTTARSGTARVELLSEETGAVVRTWTVQSRPGQASTVAWDGSGPAGIQQLGSYRFRVAPGTASARVSAASSGQSFLFADHLFPIRGRHNLGYSQTNNFGGARNHKGQDMFARCGTRLAAARGGRVQYAGYHRYAGYYAVIDGAETGVDYVYMHMRRPALVETGDRVFTGQKLGEVGETGRATGCHLHFEMWSAPGWYEGGSAFDPLPALRGWDSYS